MGEIDISVKEFIKINSIFAQLFSKGLYQGKVAIEPKQLRELDTVTQRSLPAKEGQLAAIERLRDAQKIAMLFEEKMAFQVILGLEGQTGIHYYMPVRCMELDALSYSHQCRKIAETAKENKTLRKYSDGVPKGTRIIPTVTVVLYYGAQPWDGPLSVYDMLSIPEEMKEWARETTADYRMNLIDAAHMSQEEINQYEGDLKAFFTMLQDNYSKESLQDIVAHHRETWYAISAIKKDKRYREYIDHVSDQELSGGVAMCATLDRIENEGKAKGVEIGKAIGEEIGKAIGREIGKEQVNRLAAALLKAGRNEDLLKSTTDEEYQRQLFEEFGLMVEE